MPIVRHYIQTILFAYNANVYRIEKKADNEKKTEEILLCLLVFFTVLLKFWHNILIWPLLSITFNIYFVSLFLYGYSQCYTKIQEEHLRQNDVARVEASFETFFFI